MIKKCIICENELKLLYEESIGYSSSLMVDGGIYEKITAGYGSKHDMSKFSIFICDNCIDDKLEKDII